MSDSTGVQNLTKFLSSLRVKLKDYRQDKEKKDNATANIFSSISDAYKNENYNSDIIRFILDPNKSGMGCKKYLKVFLEFIGLKKRDIRHFLSNVNGVKVTREENRIDVLIKNEDLKEAIIVESKINDACDQPMQLIRYYKKLTKEDEYKVLKIVYLTLNQKHPNLKYAEGYGISKEDYNVLTDEIQSLLFKTFISQGHPTYEYHKFQDYLDKFQRSDIIAQYKNLICNLGGELYMNEKELIQQIFNDKKDINEIKSLVDIYNNHGNVLYDMVNKKDVLKKIEWEEKENVFYRVLSDTKLELYYCGMYTKRYGFWMEIGFHSK